MSNRKNRKHRMEDEKPKRRGVQPKTDGQKHFIDSIDVSDIVFCTGPAGCGKSTISAGVACEYLLDPDINISNILITRPIVECGRKLGYLPGNEREKLHPYLEPILEELKLYLKPTQFRNFMEQGVIKICPLEVMRGRNYHNTFMILDEAQNAEYGQIKNFLTRIGQNSIAVLNGDITQIDLRGSNESGMVDAIDRIVHVDGVSNIELTREDVVRSGIVGKIIDYL
jgi:phosphate starvation-inducible protein PhoH and related proteins